MAKNVVTGKNEISAKNIIMADNVVVNENEAKDEKKKREFPILVALIGAVATVAAAIAVALIARGPAELPAIIFEANPHLEQAMQKVDEGNDEEALPLLAEAIALDPANPQSYLLEAEIMLRRGRQPEAVQALDASAKAVPKPLRRTMRDTRAQVKKSPVDGYIGISSAYETFGLREIAVALLKRVCEELPGESRLRRMLEGFMDASENLITDSSDLDDEREKVIVEWDPFDGFYDYYLPERRVQIVSIVTKNGVRLPVEMTEVKALRNDIAIHNIDTGSRIQVIIQQGRKAYYGDLSVSLEITLLDDSEGISRRVLTTNSVTVNLRKPSTAPFILYIQ